MMTALDVESVVCRLFYIRIDLVEALKVFNPLEQSHVGMYINLAHVYHSLEMANDRLQRTGPCIWVMPGLSCRYLELMTTATTFSQRFGGGTSKQNICAAVAQTEDSAYPVVVSDRSHAYWSDVDFAVD
jgi:hypothetical protein